MNLNQAVKDNDKKMVIVKIKKLINNKKRN